ncbi:MAG: hypothetical protein HYX93_04120 [Chloroflexi bacterium]|nr:hypothetical protein [Chloroflexota bacterium]
MSLSLRLDGSLVVAYRGQVIATTEAPPHPVTLRARKNARSEPHAPEVSLRVGVSPNGAQGNGGDGQGPTMRVPTHRRARPPLLPSLAPITPGGGHC